MSFFLPTFAWADTGDRFRIAVMPRPDPDQLEENLAKLRGRGADVLVSALQAHEAERLGLTGEAEACARANILFYSHPVPDHDVPEDRAATVAFAKRILTDHLEQGQGVVFHCFAGIGRSSTLAATTLILAGFEVDDACQRLSFARGIRVPETPAQLAWLRSVRPVAE